MADLKAKDYGVLAFIIAVIFVFLLVMGNYGEFLQPLSPQTQAITSIYRFVYISGSAVGAIFLGALFFIIYRFREKRG